MAASPYSPVCRCHSISWSRTASSSSGFSSPFDVRAGTHPMMKKKCWAGWIVGRRMKRGAASALPDTLRWGYRNVCLFFPSLLTTRVWTPTRAVQCFLRTNYTQQIASSKNGPKDLHRRNVTWTCEKLRDQQISRN